MTGPGPDRGPRRSPATVRTVRDLLADRLADPPSLDDLARDLGMSPFALVRSFRAETGLPPHAYVNHLRVRLARQLLDSGVAPADVAAEAGFADQAHLTRHFKRVVGVPPRSIGALSNREARQERSRPRRGWPT